MNRSVAGFIGFSGVCLLLTTLIFVRDVQGFYYLLLTSWLFILFAIGLWFTD